MIQLLMGIAWGATSVGLLLYAHARFDNKSELVRYGIGAGVLMACLIGWAWCVEQAAGIALTASAVTLAAVGICAVSGLAVIGVHEAEKEALRRETRGQIGYQPPTAEDL